MQLQQICFVGEDGYMYCNAIHRGGALVANPSGKWFKFLARKNEKSPLKEDSQEE
jgi:hypothetical protein